MLKMRQERIIDGMTLHDRAPYRQEQCSVANQPVFFGTWIQNGEH